MTIEEAIYCMKSYLPDTNSYTECKKCKYYKSKMDARGCYLCQSSEAHKMAIKSLEAWESVKNELKEYGSLWVSYTVKAHTEKAIEDIVDDVLKQAKEQFIEIIDKHLKEVSE